MNRGQPHPITTSRNAVAVTWFARVAFLAVFIVNVQCALLFCVTPSDFAGAYELAGTSGTVAIQGIGVAFLMWNCTYPLVIWQPWRFRVLAGVVLAQQVVGLVGEVAIRVGLSTADHALLASSIDRFIMFDAAGLIIMGAAFVWMAIAHGREAGPSRHSYGVQSSPTVREEDRDAPCE